MATITHYCPNLGRYKKVDRNELVWTVKQDASGKARATQVKAGRLPPESPIFMGRSEAKQDAREYNREMSGGGRRDVWDDPGEMSRFIGAHRRTAGRMPRWVQDKAGLFEYKALFPLSSPRDDVFYVNDEEAKLSLVPEGWYFLHEGMAWGPFSSERRADQAYDLAATTDPFIEKDDYPGVPRGRRNRNRRWATTMKKIGNLTADLSLNEPERNPFWADRAAYRSIKGSLKGWFFHAGGSVYGPFKTHKAASKAIKTAGGKLTVTVEVWLKDNLSSYMREYGFNARDISRLEGALVRAAKDHFRGYKKFLRAVDMTSRSLTLQYSRPDSPQWPHDDLVIDAIMDVEVIVEDALKKFDQSEWGGLFYGAGNTLKADATIDY